MSHSFESGGYADFEFVGEHAHLLSKEEVIAGIGAACRVMDQHGINPEECRVAAKKLAGDELLDKTEALSCLIWDEAKDNAFQAATLGWLARNVDIRLEWK